MVARVYAPDDRPGWKGGYDWRVAGASGGTKGGEHVSKGKSMRKEKKKPKQKK
jgi:hypothetical protein